MIFFIPFIWNLHFNFLKDLKKETFQLLFIFLKKKVNISSFIAAPLRITFKNYSSRMYNATLLKHIWLLTNKVLYTVDYKLLLMSPNIFLVCMRWAIKKEKYIEKMFKQYTEDMTQKGLFIHPFVFYFSALDKSCIVHTYCCKNFYFIRTCYWNYIYIFFKYIKVWCSLNNKCFYTAAIMELKKKKVSLLFI